MTAENSVGNYNPHVIFHPSGQFAYMKRTIISVSPFTNRQNGVVGSALEVLIDPNFNRKEFFLNVKDLTPLHSAAYQGRFKVVGRLLSESVIDIDARIGEGEYTALHLAAAKGHLACVVAILKHRPDLRLKTKNGKTAKQLAKLYKHKGVVRAIKDHKKEQKQNQPKRSKFTRHSSSYELIKS